MTQPDHLLNFVRQCNLATSEEQLFGLLDETTKRLGFERFAMGHHVDLAGPPGDAVRLTTYDPNWVEIAVEKRLFVDDPIHAASAKTAVGFLWSDVGKLIELTDRQKATLEAARKFGLAEGFTVPVHVPGEYQGTCSFGARSLDNLAADALPQAQLVGAFAFEAARRILRAKRRSSEIGQIPSLTDRQINCITLVAMGKSDWEIGRILDISQATAHEHVEAARKRYGVSKRTQLVIRALFDGQISFSDILN
ncbi:MAG TPA: LuxR family transcriptional regulator [Allosphingosinicella sp.]|nr:LuxR family transcriptional regulator [Allosphingosinicella sp.]